MEDYSKERILCATIHSYIGNVYYFPIRKDVFKGVFELGMKLVEKRQYRDDRGLRFEYGGHFADPDDVGLPLETRRRPARLQGPRRDLQADRPGARMAR